MSLAKATLASWRASSPRGSWKTFALSVGAVQENLEGDGAEFAYHFSDNSAVLTSGRGRWWTAWASGELVK